MELIFPFKNLALNNLIPFFEEERMKEFVKYKSESDEWRKEHFENDIAYYRERLPNFENEILQIVNTTNQETIDFYFKELSENYDYLKELLDKENFIQQIEDWNNQAHIEYAELVEKKTNEYFEKEERNKFGHLEKYETFEFSGLFPIFGNSEAKKVTKTNYNFYCIEETPDLIPIEFTDEYYELVLELSKEFMAIAAKYGQPWTKGEIKSKAESNVQLKPIIFFEGEHDITFIKKAAELLGKEELISQLELRQRGSCSNLDKLWRILVTDNWETNPQTKILIYDCDTNRENEDFGHIFRRTIPSISENIVKRGIENLFPNELIQRAIEHKKEFVDFRETKGTKRGIEYTEEMNVINKDEKKNFCDWVCSYGSNEDFKNFEIVFEIIEKILKAADNNG